MNSQKISCKDGKWFVDDKPMTGNEIFLESSICSEDSEFWEFSELVDIIIHFKDVQIGLFCKSLVDDSPKVKKGFLEQTGFICQNKNDSGIFYIYVYDKQNESKKELKIKYESYDSLMYIWNILSVFCRTMPNKVYKFNNEILDEAQSLLQTLIQTPTNINKIIDIVNKELNISNYKPLVLIE